MGVFRDLLFPIIGDLIRNLIGGDEFREANEAARLAIEQAETEAEAALEGAEISLDQFMGQLGDEFATYDDWYNAQIDEWNAGGSVGTLGDYIADQQLEELGEYGIQRASLESKIEIARMH